MSTLRMPSIAAMAVLFVVAGPLAAFQPVEEPAASRLARAYAAPELAVEPALEELGDLSSALVRPELAAFTRSFGADWIVRWDRRSDRPHLLQGSGVAIVPGEGNGLLPVDVGLLSGEAVTLELVARRLQEFVAAYPELLDVEGFDLRLDRSRSTVFGAGDTHWFVEFAQFHDGVPVEGANVFFRLSQGNLVQFGADRVAPVAVETRPDLDRSAAFAATLRELQFPENSLLAEVLDGGSLHLYPILRAGEAGGERFSGAAGTGYDHLLAWKFVFRLPGEAETYQVLFDALRDQVLEVRDLNAYVDATVSGGIYPTTNTEPETVVNFPFATLSNNGTKITDAAGVYDYSGGTSVISLNGQYFQMSDACGAISLCELDRRQSRLRHQRRHRLHDARHRRRRQHPRFALGLLPSDPDQPQRRTPFSRPTPGSTARSTANMNINITCNAFWNGSTLNFYRSGGGCSNTGELAAVFLHEWGHGMDTNTGGSAPGDQGSGEAVGDTFAFLETARRLHRPELPAGRQLQQLHRLHRRARRRGLRHRRAGGRSPSPANVTNNAGINCDRFACPYHRRTSGPMGYEGHCESYIASSANWDLTQMLDRPATAPTPGWAAMDTIWYEQPDADEERLPSVRAGRAATRPRPSTAARATNWYTVYLPADDDDGNLANGTPNGCRIWDAFYAHGIACGARPACFCGHPATANAGLDAAICDGQSTTIGTAALAGHTYLWSPGGATTAQILVSPSTTTVYTVTATTTCDQQTDAVTVTALGPPPTADAGTDATICEGQSTTIGTPALPGHTYLWSPGGQTTAQVLVSPVIDTTYTVTATTACSSLGDSVDVFVQHAPAAPALVSPADGALGVDPPVVLSWAASPGATSYLVELASDAGFVNFLGSQTVAGPTANFGTLRPFTYFWRVKATGSCGQGPASAIFSFTVDSVIFIDGFESGNTAAWSATVP